MMKKMRGREWVKRSTLKNAREIVDTGAHEKKIRMEKRAKGGAKTLPKTVTCQHIDERCGATEIIDVQAQHAAVGVNHIDALNV